MGGDIKIVKKEGPGTLLRLYLVVGQPVDSEPEMPRMSVPFELENAKVSRTTVLSETNGSLLQQSSSLSECNIQGIWLPVNIVCVCVCVCVRCYLQ